MVEGAGVMRLGGFVGFGRFWRFVVIDGITEDRSAEVFEVDAELVGATGGGFQLEQGVFIILGEDFVIGLGGFAVLANLEGSGAF